MQDFDLSRLKDKDWRIRNLYKIVDIDSNLVTFSRNRSQEHFNKHKHNRNIILKSRRLGFTTEESIDGLDDVMFIPNFRFLMLSYDAVSQLDIFDSKIMTAWNNMDEDLKRYWIVDTERANELKFDFGEGQTSVVQVRTKGRSGTFNRAHVSEFAKICRTDPRKAKEIISGTLQAVPLSGRIDIESTAEGEFGQFYDMFWEAWERGEPQTPVDFKAHFYNWTFDERELKKITHPEDNLPKEFIDYQKKHNLSPVEITYYYYKWLTLNKDWDLLHQEYPTTPEEAFIASGAKLFNAVKLGEMEVKDGTRVGDWIYFEDYIPGHRYALACDPSEGIGRDQSAIVIIDFDHKEQKRLVPQVVATYSNNKIPPDLLAIECRNGARAYGNCIVAVERNGVGMAVLMKLKEIYHHIFTEVRQDKLTDKVTERLGWQSNTATKPKMLYDLSTAVNNDDIAIPSKEIIRQARTYDKEDLSVFKTDPDQPHHWDLLMACGIAYQMASHAIPSEIKRDPDEVDTDVDNSSGDDLDRFGIF